jgi:hypothetical protein
MMKTISMASLRIQTEAKKRSIGWVDSDANTELLRNKGDNRTSEKRELLARIEARSRAAGKIPIRSYY